ncbi:MAG TPA: protein kinase family protein [Mycobacteriales bacterium]|nr:protein kinase family protein [Mycobacteriales bacterium]
MARPPVGDLPGATGAQLRPGPGGAATPTRTADPASPTGPGAGDVLGGRYRLDRLIRAADADLAVTDGGALWRAEDLVLSRRVAVRLVTGARPGRRRAFLSAARQSGRVAHPLVAATYDAAEELSHGTNVAYLVREWVDGRTLRDLLLDAPLAPERATFLLGQAAQALAHLHEAGVVHGRVHPANVLVRYDGQVRLTDPAIGTALTGPENDSEIAPPPESDDVHDLGRTLYAALTGRWPGGPWRGLASAPLGPAGAPLPPRQVRAGLSRELDAVAIRLLDPTHRHAHAAAPLTSAESVAGALAPLPARPTDAPEDTPRPAQRHSQHRPWRRRALLGGLIIVLGTTGWLLGQSVGRVPGQPTNVPAFTAQPSAPGAAAAAPAPLADIVKVTDFDPPPGDGIENPDQVAFAHDGEQATAWQTETYTTAKLGNLKKGVGLIVDLGSPQQIRRVDLTFLQPGTDVELRAMAPDATAPGTTLDAFPLVAQVQNAGQAVAFTTNAKSRFWLVWLTSLPKVGGGYRGSVAEMAFRR